MDLQIIEPNYTPVHSESFAHVLSGWQILAYDPSCFAHAGLDLVQDEDAVWNSKADLAEANGMASPEEVADMLSLMHG